MKRILTYAIGADSAGWHIQTFLKQKQYSRSVITQLKKTDHGILVNGNWAYVNHILKEGDILTIQLIELPYYDEPSAKLLYNRTPSSDLPFDVIYEDEDLLVVNKPAGMPIHPSMDHYGDTLSDAIQSYTQRKQEWYPYRCINRLDRDTSGLTIIAKNAYSSCILYRQMHDRKILRTYYAIAEGYTEASGTIDAPIARRDASVIERIVDYHSGERAVTHYHRLAYQDGLSFLKIHLETGRTHQIRVHMRHLGHPLIGDFLYNPKDSRMKRQALHAGNLEFAHPIYGNVLRLHAPLPEDMLQFFQVVIP